MCLEEVGLHAQGSILTTLGSKVNMVEGTPIQPLNEHKCLRLGNAYDIHGSSKSYEANWLRA